MPSTLQAATAYAAHTLSILSVFAAVTNAHTHHPTLLSHLSEKRTALSAMTYQGCFSSSDGLTDQGSYTYQTSGYCQPICVDKSQAVLATSGGSDCWCGDVIPPASDKVDDSNCDSPCNGYDKENCGGDGFWSVYLSGTESSVPYYSGSDSSSSSSAASSSTAAASTAPTPATTPVSSLTSSTTASASVVTSVGPGKTIVVTMPASQQSGESSPPSPKPEHKSSPNVGGIAAGVVVGVVAAAALIAGLVFWLRHKRRQAAEDEYKRSNQISSFMRGGRDELKPPPTAYSNMSDSRLDPEAGRRNSAGSIADDQDYSRRILRVANPDDS